MEPQSLNSDGIKLIFWAGGRGFGIDYILSAAEFRGELAPLRRAWTANWLAAMKAEAEGSDPAQAVVDQLATDFRYSRNLVTADECERWLAALGLTSDDFSAHFLRLGLAGPGGLFAAGTSGAKPSLTHAVMDADQARAFRVDLLLSKEFPELARALAWRVALQCEHKTLAGAGEIEGEQTLVLENPRGSALSMDDGVAPGVGAASWHEELAALEVLFQARAQALLTAASQQRALAALRLSLLRFDLEVLELESEAAGREAFLCATEDGVSLADLAAQNGHPLRRVTSLLEDLSREWQYALMSASPGAVLPPFAVGGGFQLCRLVAKRDAVLTDSGVLARVNANLVRAHFQELENRYVRWEVKLAGEE